MDKFIKNFMIRTFFAIFFLVVIAAAFTVIGGDVLQLSGSKTQNNRADFTIRRSKLFVYTTYESEFKAVTKVQHRTETAEDKSLVTTVYMINDSTKVSLFESATSDNDKLKRDLYNDLSFFINDGTRNIYSKMHFKINKFGWIGIGLFAIAIIWLINLPKIKKRLIDEMQEEDKKKRIDKLHEERVHGLKNSK
ncbi:MAG: hypothetical protein PF638_07710 [Candidatus Delongbacteria bacterium]|jgi:hypothetical protein|nr:hypothetical protein [Candidatus Delongbacteria bacterium]